MNLKGKKQIRKGFIQYDTIYTTFRNDKILEMEGRCILPEVRAMDTEGVKGESRGVCVWLHKSNMRDSFGVGHCSLS